MLACVRECVCVCVCGVVKDDLYTFVSRKSSCVLKMVFETFLQNGIHKALNKGDF